jgi:DNA-binding transcriptional ArsR family regulator
MKEAQPPSVAIEGPAEMFRVLGHETRLRLLLLLAANELSVGALETVSGVGQPALSQQLAILRQAELVATRRVAKQVYYRVDPAAVKHAAAILASLTGAPLPRTTDRTIAEKQKPEAAGSAAGFARML